MLLIQRTASGQKRTRCELVADVRQGQTQTEGFGDWYRNLAVCSLSRLSRWTGPIRSQVVWVIPIEQVLRNKAAWTRIN
jgi:hypothetical protein